MRSEILKFFSEKIDSIEGCDGGGLQFSLPPFDLKPKDFLSFSELDLNSENTQHSLVNATSNLKRAMDCELDTLMFVLGLDDFYRKKRLGIEKKLGFLRRSEIFKATSLDRLNKLRNRLEHHYEIPNLEDVEVYYDLVTAFISIGDSFLYKLRSVSVVSLSYIDSNFKTAAGSSICLQSPKVELDLFNEGNKKRSSFCIEPNKKATVESLNNFAYLLKVNLLMGDFYYGSISKDEFISSLESEI
ncbi:hypothetical protein [Shewanella salipaludis]|uniref:RiboL-PSP-HEPN domain-containing protein n=1 Tax=Shewanella salipaludis TaxID=2723052 RepID=A0A972FS90_9GAMM|nr:hypothetical protein [Shewanella salipaludis]NMH64309.1 hypothetical protein [Shewanella salipaludis]